MDTTTVLAIIKMIDVKLNSRDIKGEDLCIRTCNGEYECVWPEYELAELRDHLQSFIEGQLNAAENQTME